MFPSPYGVTVIKSDDYIIELAEEYEFPSPYGVTVIKSTMFNNYYEDIRTSFRPLTG